MLVRYGRGEAQATAVTRRMKGNNLVSERPTGLIFTSDKSSICISGFMIVTPPPTDSGICLITRFGQLDKQTSRLELPRYS